MAANKPVWGIDLGQCALKAIRLRLAGDKVEALDHVYIEHHRILSQPDADRVTLIAEAMKKFTADHDLTKETLIVGVPGQNTLARFTKLPPVPKKKIPEIVKYEAQQQIPFDMEEVIWDYQIFEDAGATETQVGIFAMRRELLRSHLSFLSSLDLEPALVQSSPLALYNALRYDGIVGTEPICILDIGAQNTDLIVVDGDSLWTRNIPIGGNNFTEALLKTFKLSFNKAEKLKRDAGTHKYSRQIFQAMRPVFADLVAEVQRSIGFFTSSRRGVKLSKLIAMGNAFKLPGMVKFIQQNLGMEIIRPNSFNRLSASGAANAPQLMDQLLSYAVAYGLALQGLGKGQITSNLLPPEIAKQVVWRKKTPWFYGSAACLAVASLMVWSRNYMDSAALAEATGGKQASAPQVAAEQDAQRIVDQGPPGNPPLKLYAGYVASAGQKLSQSLSEAQSKNDQEENKAQELAKLQTYKVVWPKLLHLVHAALPKPDDVWNKAMLQGADAVKALLQANPDKYLRANRKEIFISKFDATYSKDVISQYNSMKQKGTIPGAEPPSSTATNLPGFVITLKIRTPYRPTSPYESTSFVNNTFLDRLRKDAVSPPMGVYFDSVGAPVNPTPVRLWKGGAVSGGTVGGAARSWGGSGASDAGIPADKDPVTGESINDTEFEIMFAAVMGEKPKPAATATPGGKHAAAPANNGE